MVAVKVNAFGGMIPATDSKLLPDNAADTTQNVWLYNGKLQGIVQEAFVRNLTNANDGTTYRIPISYADALHFSDAYWMDMPSIDTDVVRCPVVGDTFQRYYFASALSGPQVTSLPTIIANQTTGGTTGAFALGVPTPTVAPTIGTITGGTTPTEARSYVVTWETAFNEEGAPSPPSVVTTGNANGTWPLTLTPPDSTQISSNNLAYANIYRTVTDSSGNASFYFVAQVAVTATSYSDSALDTTIEANNLLQSTTWTPPPTDLQGLLEMPNGMIVSWRENEIWFCEPYRPHAWPAQYTLAVEYPVVGLGVLNQTLVVLTEGYPMVASGLNPGSMSLSTLSSLEPCLSRGSIISAPEGVYYASPNGLIMVANGICTNMTQQLITKDEWNAYTNISTLRAARLGTAYYAYGSARPGVFETDTFETDTFQQQDYTGAYNGIYIEPSNQRVAFNTVTSAGPISDVFTDQWSGECCIVYGGAVYHINLADATGPRKPFTWKSKIFQPTDRKNFGAMRIYFEIAPWSPPPNPNPRNTASPQTLQSYQYGIVNLFANGNLVMTRELVTSGELMKLPSGFKADFWQVEIQANVIVNQLQLATSDKELRKV